MDNLKTLMDRKDYDLVVKLTASSLDITSLFYRIAALFALNRAKEALEVINNHKSILDKNLPALIKIHIEILCFLDMFDEAYAELKKYEDYPYYSQNCEEIIQKMPTYIRTEERKSLKVSNLSDEQLKKLLKSSSMEDVICAIDVIRNRDYTLFLNDIKNILINFPLQSVRSFALLFLVQKEYHKEVNFNHNGQIISVIPTSLEPPFVGPIFNNFTRQVQLEFKDPVLAENAIEIASSYVIYYYPDKQDLLDPAFILALEEISAQYLKINTLPSLEERCNNKSVDIKKVNDIIGKINKALEEF